MSILQLLDSNGYIAEGEILFEGRDLTKLSQQEMYDVRGNKISVIFQEPMTSLNPVFSVEKQLTEPFIIHQGMKKKNAIDYIVYNSKGTITREQVKPLVDEIWDTVSIVK